MRRFPFLRATIAAAFLTQASLVYSQTLNIVAHQDDDLLFLSPNLLHEIESGRNVRTIFLTSGDAGSDASYWLSRQEGSKAAYAEMSNNADNSWTQTDAGVPGFNIPAFTLTANPQISLVFLQLPDGNVDGGGFPSTGSTSLQKLWEGQVSTMQSFTGSTYSKDDLTNTLTALIADFQPDRLNTQDFVDDYGTGDHSDHTSTGLFVDDAVQNYCASLTLTSYMGYPVQSMASNVEGDELTAKKEAFLTYKPFDTKVCDSQESCKGDIEMTWVSRQYTVSSDTFTGCQLQSQKQSVSAVSISPTRASHSVHPPTPSPTRASHSVHPPTPSPSPHSRHSGAYLYFWRGKGSFDE